MINATLNTLFFRPEYSSKTAHRIARELCKKLATSRGSLPHNYNYTDNRRKRYVYSFQWLIEQHKQTSLSKEDLQALYDIANTKKTDIDKLRTLYVQIFEQEPICIDDVNGLRGPIKALMVMLWSEKQILLPLLFDRKGVSATVPEIYKLTDGFVAEMISYSTNENLKHHFREFVYTTDWTTETEISFSELWETIPKLLLLTKEYKALDRKTDYPKHWCILSFAGLFSALHPKIIDSNKIILLEKYQQSLSASRHLEKNIATPEEFENYFNSSYSNRLKQRQDINGVIQVKRNLGLEHAPDDPEGYFSALASQRHRKGLSWLNDNFYGNRPELDISTSTQWWRPAMQSYRQYLNRKVEKSARGQTASYLNILWDYVFCYLPHWRSINPDSPIKLPIKINDFYREFFWNRYDSDSFDGTNTFEGIKLPVPLIELYKTRRSDRQLTQFIRAVYNFFKFCIAERKQIKLNGQRVIDDYFRNPVEPSIDSQGSGPRGNTNKIVLPLKVVPYIEAYTHLLNVIGVDFQKRLLAGEFEQLIKQHWRGTYIDLAAFGLNYTIEIPGSPGEVIKIPIKEIPNCFNWKRDIYKRKDGSTYETILPHLGSLRMLMVSLHAGQRMQNSQWLDLDTFDEYERFNPDNKSYLATLLINTDKITPERTVSIQRSVFNILLEEKYFQLNTLLIPPKEIHYENDEHTKYKKYRPLFRSTFSEEELPFSDTTYGSTWVKILQGLQELYNSQRPENEHHTFVYHSGRAFKAIHTPHALRTTWITWMRLYGGLEYVLIMKQVGHSEITMSFHYTAPDVLETNSLIEEAFHQRNQAASTKNPFDLITSTATRPSLETSALRSGLLFNPQATIEQQRLFSVSSQFVESKQTGLGMIDVLNLGSYGYYDDCICPFNGKCPKALLNFTGMARCCSICPFAIWGLDHLEGVEAKKRFYQLRVNHLLQVFDHLIERKEEKAAQEIRADLSLASLELAGYHQISNVIRSEIEKHPAIKSSYAMRRPEILEKHCKIKIDIEHPGWRYISNLIDLKNYPQFCADSYLQILNRFSRNLPPLGIEDEKRTPLDRVLAQISATMKSEGINLSQLADRLSSDQYRLEVEEHE